MGERLDEDQINSALEQSSWRRDGNAIVRDWEFKDFAEAWSFADQVATTAEALNHHPDILAHGWNRLRVTITSHSAGGITAADFSLAAAVDLLT
ncbi:MAG: 4a-hydroxytetrahydrobiopterin dehydratase [Actinomycetes bacterium]|nr:4a-hydroxytetrahydrobiopterin dehydratase [Solirubrobacterales bacterium]